MTEAITTIEPQTIVSDTFTPQDIVRQVTSIQEVMAAVMKDGEHYGKIPGCGDKPALLQPGAQVLAFMFRLAPSFDIETHDLANLHREYLVRCSLVAITTGQVVGMGIGSCSTMESKYRYRNIADFELTGEPIPQDSKEKKAEYRRQGFGMKKVEGVWEWVHFKDSAKTENPDIADTYNTVLKMASKRAFVHAVLNATAASDMFTQDIEDLPAADITPVPRLNDAEKAAIIALFEDLAFSPEQVGAKVRQAGAPAIDALTSEQARKLIENLGAIRKQRAEKASEQVPAAVEIGEDEIPF